MNGKACRTYNHLLTRMQCQFNVTERYPISNQEQTDSGETWFGSSCTESYGAYVEIRKDALAKELFCQRQYMSTSFWRRVQEKRSEEEKKSSSSQEEEKRVDLSEEKTWYDPRFLVFEYSSGFVLRKRQCELVSDFVASAKYGKRSCFHQMIMGAGKTRVIGPMLALILADGTSLVTQVCPSALLEMTRGVMRETFSRVLSKRIYTLKFDRQCDAAESRDKPICCSRK